MGREVRFARVRTFLVIILLLAATVQPLTSRGPDHDSRDPRTHDSEEGRSGEAMGRSGPPWPEPGLGLPSHYADWALIASPLEWSTVGVDIFPRFTDGGDLEVLALVDTGRAYKYAHNGSALRQVQYAPLDFSAGTWRAHIATVSGGSDALFIENSLGDIRSYWADDLSYRSTLHTSSRLLGSGDWDGDGEVDIWVQTGNGLIIVLNSTSGHPLTTSRYAMSDRTFESACADVDGDGMDELVILSSNKHLRVADGPRLETQDLITFPSYMVANRLRVVPRDGRPPLVVAPMISGGVLWYDLGNGTLDRHDTDMHDVIDVVYTEGAQNASSPRVYLMEDGEVVRRTGVDETTTVTYEMYDDGGALALARGPDNATALLVVTRKGGLRLINATDLATLATAVEGPRDGLVLSSGPDLRAKGLDGDALVLTDGIYLLNSTNGSAYKLVGVSRRVISAVWSPTGFGDEGLFVLIDHGVKSRLERYRVSGGTLQRDESVYHDLGASLLAKYNGTGGPDRLLLVDAAGLNVVDPLQMTINLTVEGTIEAPALGDVDGDGDPELVYYDGNDSIRCIAGGNLTMKWHRGVPYDVETLMVGEVDGDIFPELVVSYTSGHLEVLDGQTLEVEATTEGSPICNVTSMTSADVDLDGRPELVLARGTHRDVIVAEVTADGCLTEEWHWWARADDWPVIGGTIDVDGGAWLPLLGVHPFAAVSFTDGARLGDLRVDDLAIEGEDLTEGDEVQLSVTVSLEGGFPSDFAIDLYMDPREDGEDGPFERSTVHLEPGDSATVRMNWTAALGAHTIQAVANGLELHNVAERDYSNNALSIDVEVSVPYARLAWELGYGEATGTDACTATVDTDGDGSDELVMLDGGGHLVILDLEDAAPGSDRAADGFATPAWRSEKLVSPPFSMEVGDPDGDGHPVAVVGGFDGWVHVLDLTSREVSASAIVSGLGVLDVGLVRDGLLNVTRVAALDAIPMLHILSLDDLTEVGAFPSCPGGSRLEVADLDGDSMEEVVVVGDRPFMAIHPYGGVGARTLLDIDLENVSLTVLEDLDDDGHPELVAATMDRVSVVGIRGEPRWACDVLWSVETPVAASAIAVEDWDWDGVRELLVAGGTFRSYEMSTWSPQNISLVPSVELDPGSEVNGMALGHFPHRPGLLAALPLRDGRLLLVDGLRNATEVLFSNLGVRTLSLIVGDPDAEGIPTLLVGTATAGVVAVDGISLGRAPFSLPWTAWSLAVLDWDGDGEDEVAAQGPDGDLVILGQDGNVEGTVAEAVEGRVVAMAVLDADGDGAPRLAWAEEDWTIHVTDLSTLVTMTRKWSASGPIQLSPMRMDNGTMLLLVPRTGGFASMDPRDLDATTYYPVHADTTAIAAMPTEVGIDPLVVAADGLGRLHVVDMGTGETTVMKELGGIAHSLLARDLDLDGRVEVVAVTSDDSVHILRGDTLAPLIHPIAPMGSPITSMVATDLDLDGAIEVVLGGWSELVAIRVGVGDPLPDITLSVQGYPEEAIEPGLAFDLRIDVVNRGTVPTGTFRTVVTLEGGLVHSANLTLGPLCRDHLSVQVNLTGWGSNATLTVEVDINDTVPEFDEGNNLFETVVRTVTVPVVGPDVWIQGLTADPAQVLQGMATTVSVMLTNVGTAPFYGQTELFAIDGADRETGLSVTDITCVPGGSLVIEHEIMDIDPSIEDVRVDLRSLEGDIVDTARVPLEVIPRANLGIFGISVNATLTPRVVSGGTVHLDVLIANTGGLEGGGVLVLQADSGDRVEILAARRFALSPGEVATLAMTVIPPAAGALVLEGHVFPDGDDIRTDDDGRDLTLLVAPDPRTYGSISELLVSRSGPSDSVHLTIVVRTANFPQDGSLTVRVYSLEPSFGLSIAADPLSGIGNGTQDVFNATKTDLGAVDTVIFDAVVRMGPLADGTTVILAVVFYNEGNVSMPIDHAMEVLPGLSGTSGGGGGDNGVPVWLVLCAIGFAAIAGGIASYLGLRRRQAPPRSGARKAKPDQPDDAKGEVEGKVEGEVTGQADRSGE